MKNTSICWSFVVAIAFFTEAQAVMDGLEARHFRGHYSNSSTTTTPCTTSEISTSVPSYTSCPITETYPVITVPWNATSTSETPQPSPPASSAARPPEEIEAPELYESSYTPPARFTP